jgi:hypothetical protein
MSEPTPNPFDLLIDQIRTVVREEIAAALAKRSPEKLLYTTKEAAGMLNVDESWLATKARAGLVPSRQLGHYRYFSMADIELIVDKAYVQGVQSKHDGQGASTDSKAVGIESGKAGNGVRNYHD